MCAPLRAFIEDSGTAKNAGKQLNTGIFCGTGFYKRREKKKDDLSLAIGENYNNKKLIYKRQFF